MADKLRIKLIGEDGNIFFILGKVSKEMCRNGQDREAREMGKRVMSSNSYHEALAIIMEYVDIY